MRTVRRLPQETLEALVRRRYTLLTPDGHEDAARLSRALQAVRDANPGCENEASEMCMPPVAGVPYLRQVVDNLGNAELALRRGLRLVLRDERLLALSFIDPLRVGSEELGIVGTPPIAAAIRSRFARLVSFDQQRYEALRDEPWDHGRRSALRWVPHRRRRDVI